MPYKSFDNDINGTCNPQINKTKRLLCIYNVAIKLNHQISKSLNYPPTRPKLLTIARFSHVYLHITKGHISTDFWELFSAKCTCRCSGATILYYIQQSTLQFYVPYLTIQRLLQNQIVGGSFSTRPNIWTTLSLHLFSLKSPYTKLCLRYTLRSSRNPLLYIL